MKYRVPVAPNGHVVVEAHNYASAVAQVKWLIECNADLDSEYIRKNWLSAPEPVTEGQLREEMGVEEEVLA